MNEKETIPSEQKSPYSEPQQRPESASKAPITSPHYAKPRAKSAKSAESRATSSHKRKGKKKKNTDKNEKEIKKVSNLVRQKLELYVNEEKRQNRFNPQGVSTTTRRMAEFDVAYKLLEFDQLEKNSPRNPRNSNTPRKSKSSDPYDIQPKLIETSRRVTGYSEADRLAKYSSEVFASYPVEKLAVIHRYRPHPKEQIKGPEAGNVLGYTGHVGAALHQQAYVDFYVKEGMDSANPKTSARIKRLPKINDKSSSRNSSHSSLDTTKNNSRQAKTKHKKPKKDKNPPVHVEKKSSSENSVGKDMHSDVERTKLVVKTKQDKYNGNDSDASSNSDTNTGKKAQESKRARKKSDELHNKNKESLDKTWEYYESSNAKDEDESIKGTCTTISNDDNKDNRSHDSCNDEYKDNRSHVSGDEQERKSVRSLKNSEKADGSGNAELENGIESKETVKRQKSGKDDDNKSMRSYVSVEYVREVEIKDI